MPTLCGESTNRCDVRRCPGRASRAAAVRVSAPTIPQINNILWPIPTLPQHILDRTKTKSKCRLTPGMLALIGVEPPQLIGTGCVTAAFCRRTVDSGELGNRRVRSHKRLWMSTRLQLVRPRGPGGLHARRAPDAGDRVRAALRRFCQLGVRPPIGRQSLGQLVCQAGIARVGHMQPVGTGMLEAGASCCVRSHSFMISNRRNKPI